MIPQDYITAWSRVAPWASHRQVEQDLIISRALFAIFSDPFPRGEAIVAERVSAGTRTLRASR